MSALTDIFTDIANSLRSKMGVADTFKPDQMAPAINNMSTVSVVNPYSELTTSSEGVTGFVCSEASIPNSTISTQYGDINVVYNYNRLNVTSRQVFEVTDAGKLFNNNTNSVMSFNYIKFGNNVTNMQMTFSNCRSFNQPVTIGNNVTKMRFTFNGCWAFNQPVTIPNSVTDMGGVFSNCRAFNQPVTIGNNVTDISNMFGNCNNFNQPVTIPNSVTNIYGMFVNCTNLNQPVTIPNSVNNILYLFFGCTSFNQPVTIPDSVTEMSYTFERSGFNQPIIIPDSVTSAAGAFSESSFNQSITIPSRFEAVNALCGDCDNFGSSVYFKSPINASMGVANIFIRCNNSLRKNIYCDNASIFIKTYTGASITGTSVTWATMDNGYYNASFNIYIYNNWTQT